MQVKSIAVNAGQKYCRMLPWIKIPNDFQAFVLSTFEWSLKTGFTVFSYPSVLTFVLNAQKNCLIEMVYMIVGPLFLPQ